MTARKGGPRPATRTRATNPRVPAWFVDACAPLAAQVYARGPHEWHALPTPGGDMMRRAGFVPVQYEPMWPKLGFGAGVPRLRLKYASLGGPWLPDWYVTLLDGGRAGFDHLHRKLTVATARALRAAFDLGGEDALLALARQLYPPP